jgi:hypothetical protein
MPDPQDVLTPEDTDALIHAQQQLFASGDPRASKLYDYITQQGYATKGPQGELVRSNQASMAPQPTLGERFSNFFQHPLNEWESESLMQSRPAGASIPEMVGTDVHNFAAGAGNVIRHPLQAAGNMLSSGFGARPLVETAENALVEGAGKPAPNPDAQILPQSPEQAAYALGQTAMTAGVARNLPAVPKIASTIVDAASDAADLPPPPAPKPTIAGQNYAPAHAKAFEGAIAPAAAMGKNFMPQNITPQALTPIRATASRMMQGNPLEQATVRLATDPATAPLPRIQAYQQVVQTSLRDLEQLHSSALNSAADVPVDTKPLVQNLMSHISATTDAADAAAIRGLAQRVQQAKTIGDLNTFRQELNNETSPEYRQSQIQAGRSGTSAQAASDLAGDVRNAYYDNLGEATGVDYSPLKRREANLLTTLESLQNQQSMLAKQEATFNAPTTLREKAGNVAAILQNPRTTVTQTLLRESPATRVSLLLQKSLADLPGARPSYPQLGRGAITGQPPPGPEWAAPPPPPVAATTRAQRLGLLLKAPPIELPGAVEQSAPAYSPDTVAARQGRLLPQQSGAPTVPPNLQALPAMTPGERPAALMQLLRQQSQLRLARQAQPFQLPASQQ